MKYLAAGLAALWIAFSAGAGEVAPRDSFVVTSIRIGFSSNSPDSTALYKNGFWTPVYVNVKCQSAVSQSASLIVESNDSDGVPTDYSVPVPHMLPDTTKTIIGYTRPGGRGDFRIRLQGADRDLIEPVRRNLPTELTASNMLYLAAGTKLGSSFFSNGGASQRTVTCNIAHGHELPDFWIGYDGADVVILNDANREFVAGLSDERKHALTAWVRRGGNLVVSLGTHSKEEPSPLSDLLPVELAGTFELDLPRLAWRDSSASDEPLGKTMVTRMKPRANHAVSTLVAGPLDREGNAVPLVMRGAYGFGRVTVVAFDFDSPTFREWKSQSQFWSELANHAGPHIPPSGADSLANDRRNGRGADSEDFLKTELIQQTETFSGIPIITFGWVAFGILLYIMIVGPLDYWFLNRVVKRLELTWITFPVVVLTVSLAANYFAHLVKGRELRINKLDLIDVDVASNTVLGRSWFSVFSPQIQKQDIALSPSADFAVTTGDPNRVISWFGMPGRAQYSFFAQSYAYAPNATSLLGVPLQVWSTKGFQAEWLSKAPEQSPLVETTLRQSPNGEGLIGSVTVNLPVPLENAHLIVSRIEPVVLPLGTLVSGTPKSVTAQDSRPFAGWVTSPLPGSLGWLPAKTLFHERAVAQGRTQNAGLRTLDQSWRIENDRTDQAILVGTLPRVEGTIKDVSNDSATPSKLLLHATGRIEPVVDGLMRQEVSFRAIIPVLPSRFPPQRVTLPASGK